MSGWNPGWDYPASKPIPVDGGLVSSKQRGKMADSWWSERFVAVVESYGLGGRMQRARRYARTGQVMSLDVEAGLLTADVQGSRPAPYRVTVRLPQPTTDQWTAIDELLRSRVGYAAQLLAGDVPDDLEDAFAAAGVALFPRRWPDLDVTCSCPDWGDPCKHSAAVLYVFADRLDDDPWLLLQWRGRTRDQILEPLRARTGGGGADEPDRSALAPWWPLAPSSVRGEPKHAGVGDGLDADLDRLVDVPDPPDRVLARLEVLELDVGGMPVTELLAPIYRALIDRQGR